MGNGLQHTVAGDELSSLAPAARRADEVVLGDRELGASHC